MSNFRKHIPEYRERLDGWLADHGYEPGSAATLPNRWGMMSPLLDHGFIATHKKTRRRVLFGDPYEYGLQFLPRVEWQFGISARRYAGLWKPDSSTLLELWVDDPLSHVVDFGVVRRIPKPQPTRYFLAIKRTDVNCDAD